MPGSLKRKLHQIQVGICTGVAQRLWLGLVGVGMVWMVWFGSFDLVWLIFYMGQLSRAEFYPI